MIGLPPGKCRDCGVPLAHFARPVPELPGAPTCPIRWRPWRRWPPWCCSADRSSSACRFRGSKAPPAPERADSQRHADPASDTSGDYGWIVKAMAECEEEAKLQDRYDAFPDRARGGDRNWRCRAGRRARSPRSANRSSLLNVDRRVDRAAQPRTGALPEAVGLRGHRSRDPDHVQMEAGDRRDCAQDAREQLGQPQARLRDSRRCQGNRMGSRHPSQQGHLPLGQSARSPSARSQ